MLTNKTKNKSTASNANAAINVKRGEQFVKKGVNKLKERGNKMTDNLENNAYKLGEKTRETLNKTSDLFTNGADYVENQAKDRPYTMISISFIAGMLLSKLLLNTRNN